MSEQCPIHVPVMLEPVMTWLTCRPGGVYLDLGCGPGGYALEMLRRTAPDGRVVALDVDPEMLAVAAERLAKHVPTRCRLVRSNYSQLGDVLSELGIAQVDGATIDCGLARDQILGTASKGLSFDRDEPLDMRLDPDLPTSAADLVNRIDERELRAILWELGDVRRAGRIAAAIARRREQSPITTTAQLAATIAAADTVPRHRGKARNPVVTKSFLALRVAVNAELSALEQGIAQVVAALRPGSGRLVVVAYHGSEDRIVKRRFRALERGCHCPPHLPCTCGEKPQVRVLTRRPIWASEEEVQANPSARSARLRACEKHADVGTNPAPGAPGGP